MKNVSRELVFEVEEDISDDVARALGGDDKVLDVTDEKGNRILLASASLAYVHIGAGEQRFVGFGA